MNGVRGDGVVAQNVGRGQHQFRPAILVALAGSPDGRTVYCAAQGFVCSVPLEGGSPVKVCTGEGVTPDPNGDS